MKKLLALFLLVVFLAGTSFAAIGYIDVQKVFREFKETKKAQEELSKKEEEFKKDFEESQKQLQKAEREGKERDELEKMRKDLETKLAPKRETLIRLNEKLTVELQQKILLSVTKVAKKVGIDLVLDKQVVITGGMDLTEMVITELNK